MTADQPEARGRLLVSMAGIPGSGKSSLADAIAVRIGAVVISVDPLESAILTAGVRDDQPTGLAAYLVAEQVAERILTAGSSVIVDAVNPVEPARMQWRDLAERTGSELAVVETVCSDRDQLRRRLEDRVRALPKLAEVTLERALERAGEYEEWFGEAAALRRVTIDTIEPLDAAVKTALLFLGRG